MLRVVALDKDRGAALVANRYNAVAVRKWLDRVAVFRRVLPELQRLAVGRDGRRRKGQPQHVLTRRLGIESPVGHPALAVANVVDHGSGSHDVVLAGRAEPLRLPGEHLHHHPQGPGVGEVEPLPGHHHAAVDVVFHHAGLVGVVGAEDGLPAGDLPRPGVAGQRRVAGQRGRHVHRRILQRLAAAVARLGKRPRPRVDVAGGTRIDARAAEEHRHGIADVRLPLRKGLAAVHHVLGRVAGHRAGVDGIVPVPELMAEDGVIAPPGQQDVAEVLFPGVAGLHQRVVLAAVARSYHVVKELQSQRHPGSLFLAPIPGGILGVGVAGPWHRAGPQIAVLGQQVGPVLDGRQVAGISRHLVGPQQGRAELPAEVQLDEAVRVGLPEGLAFHRCADDEVGPGVIGRRLAVVQQVVGGQGHDADGRRVARVAIILGHSAQRAHRPLADVGVHPIVQLRADEDGAVGLDPPAPGENEIGRRHDRHFLVRPGIAFERLGGHADAEVALAVLAAIPRRDDPVAVLDDRMGEVFLHRRRVGRRRRDRPSEHAQQE